jgi:hypothetical protein
VRHWLDVGPGALVAQGLTQSIAVVGTFGEQDLASAHIAKHVGRTAAVMRLDFGQLQGDRQAVGIDQGIDLGGSVAVVSFRGSDPGGAVSGYPV